MTSVMEDCLSGVVGYLPPNFPVLSKGFQQDSGRTQSFGHYRYCASLRSLTLSLHGGNVSTSPAVTGCFDG